MVENLISRNHLVVIASVGFPFVGGPQVLTAFIGCSKRVSYGVFVGVIRRFGFPMDVGSSDFFGVALEVGVFRLTFGGVHATIVSDCFGFDVPVTHSGFRCRFNNAVGFGHLITELGVYDIVVLFLSGFCLGRRALNENVFALFKNGEICDGIICVTIVFCVGLATLCVDLFEREEVSKYGHALCGWPWLCLHRRLVRSWLIYRRSATVVDE